MYQKYGIEKAIEIPDYIIKQPRFVGEELSKFGLNVGFLGLEFAPVNEQGVVALFSKIHKFIGFPRIKYISDFFPDCEGTCNIGAEEHWVSIEFKFNLRRTFIPKSDLTKWKKDVNYLVCWSNNNVSLTNRLKPVKVISLRELLSDKKLVAEINSKMG